nr:NifB/NifX family molybdenum-iron cluster-binding protein [Halanaerobium sp. MA284_MarDTE_T2]
MIVRKIALPSSGETVSQHFGHAPQFVVFSVENNHIKDKNILKNPGHRPGFLPKFLNEHGIDTVISGGMGQKAVDIFEANGINVICGALGDVEKIVVDYLADNLTTDQNACDH